MIGFYTLCYALYTPHRDRDRDGEPLFSIVPIPVPVPFPFPGPCSVFEVYNVLFCVQAIYSQHLPLLIFGTLPTVAGPLLLLLPETRGQPLPQNLEDVTNMKT